MSRPGIDRRTLIAAAGLSGAWPRIPQAQQPRSARRIAVLMQFNPGNLEGENRLAQFTNELKRLGWRDGENARIDVRWGAEDATLENRYAAELAALSPDVILASGTSSTAAVREATRTIPVVFVNIADATGAGFVNNLGHPGGNSTGFMNYEFSLAGKWLDLLKQLAPGVKRVGVLRMYSVSASTAMFAAMQVGAVPLGVEVNPLNANEPSEIERSISGFARLPNGGIVSTAGAENLYRDQIVALAERHKLPAVYLLRSTVAAGGLAAYGPDRGDQFRLAAGYVDRILKGAKPGDLPVQSPTKFNLVINVKTAKALGLTIPPALLASADEVIE